MRAPSCSVRVTERLRVLARDQPALQVDGVAVAVLCRLAEDRNRGVRVVPAHHAVVGNVGPDQIAPGREPGRSLGPAAAGVELFEVDVGKRQLAKARVDDREGRGELDRHAGIVAALSATSDGAARAAQAGSELAAPRRVGEHLDGDRTNSLLLPLTSRR